MSRFDLRNLEGKLAITANNTNETQQHKLTVKLTNEVRIDYYSTLVLGSISSRFFHHATPLLQNDVCGNEPPSSYLGIQPLKKNFNILLIIAQISHQQEE